MLQDICQKWGLPSPDSGNLYVFRLPAFRSLHNVKLDRLTFLEATESVTLNGRVMNKHVVAVCTADKSESLGIVKPLHCSLFHKFPLLWCIAELNVELIAS